MCTSCSSTTVHLVHTRTITPVKSTYVIPGGGFHFCLRKYLEFKSLFFQRDYTIIPEWKAPPSRCCCVGIFKQTATSGHHLRASVETFYSNINHKCLTFLSAYQAKTGQTVLPYNKQKCVFYLLCISSSSGEGPFCTWGVCLGNGGPGERADEKVWKKHQIDCEIGSILQSALDEPKTLRESDSSTDRWL